MNIVQISGKVLSVNDENNLTKNITVGFSDGEINIDTESFEQKISVGDFVIATGKLVSVVETVTTSRSAIELKSFDVDFNSLEIIPSSGHIVTAKTIEVEPPKKENPPVMESEKLSQDGDASTGDSEKKSEQVEQKSVQPSTSDDEKSRDVDDESREDEVDYDDENLSINDVINEITESQKNEDKALVMFENTNYSDSLERNEARQKEIDGVVTHEDAIKHKLFN